MILPGSQKLLQPFLTWQAVVPAPDLAPLPPAWTQAEGEEGDSDRPHLSIQGVPLLAGAGG